MASRRAINGAHWPNARFYNIEQCLRSVGATGAVTVLHIQAFDDPLINSHRDDENCGTFGKLRFGFEPQGIPPAPERLIHMRCYHPNSMSVQPRAYAEHIGNMFADWQGSRDQAGLRANLWDDPFVCVSSSNELNLHYENGDGNPNNQWMYQTVEHYQRIAAWDMEFWGRIDEMFPKRKALRVSPALAEGHEPDGYVVDGAYTIPEVRGMIDSADILGVHLYALLHENPQSGVDGDDKYWYIFRAFRPALYKDDSDPGGAVTQFKGKPFLLTEAGTFTHSDVDRTEETWRNFQGLYSECLAQRTCLGVTWFIWNSYQGVHPQNIIWENEDLRGRMEAAPRYWSDAVVPARSGPLPPPPPPPVETVSYAKVVWAMEEAQRILEGEGLNAESAFIGNHYTADAIRLRDRQEH